MADPVDPKDPLTGQPPAPFPVDEKEWASELAEWDAHLPISTEGATPADEIPFSETPTTVVVSEKQLADAAAEEFAQGPPSGIYASIITSVEAAESPFQEEPPAEPTLSLVQDPLPEMGEELWRGNLRALVNVPDTVPNPQPPSEAYWKGFGRLLFDQLSVADTTAQQADLSLAAARAAERAGDRAGALALYDDALVLQPNSAAAWRGRFRLLEATGDRDAAFHALRRLADTTTGDEQGMYRAIAAEWALARGQPAGTAIPVGMARALAEAEVAIRRGDAHAVAAALEQAAYASAGRLASSLLNAAARFNDAAGDFASAVEQRFVASRLSEATLPGALGRLRDAARLTSDDPEAAQASLAEALNVLPPSALSGAVARWAARLAVRRGDVLRARQILADTVPAADSPALRRDRLELAATAFAADRAAAVALFAEAVNADSDSDGRAALALRLAALFSATGAADEALAILDKGLADAPGAVPLAIAAESLGRQPGDVGLRARAFRLWAAHDPARAAAGAFAAADLVSAGDGGGSAEAQRAAWQEAARAAPSSLAFWHLAACEHAAVRSGAAAQALQAGADSFAEPLFARALIERAGELRALAAAGPTPAPTPAPALAGEPATGADSGSRATVLLRRALAISSDDRERRCDALEQVLAVVPDHPVALALLMLEGAHRPEAIASALWTVGAPTAENPTGEREAQLQAIEWLIQGSNRVRALARTRELAASQADWAPVRDLLRQLTGTGPSPAERAEILLGLAPAEGGLAQALAVAEAHEQLGHRELATVQYRQLLEGPVAGDARRGLGRLDAETIGAGWPVATLPADVQQTVARLSGWLQAARDARWGELVDRLETAPPHEDSASPSTLWLAALLDEGRRDGKRAARLIREAGRLASARRGPAPGMSLLGRVVDGLPSQEPGDGAAAAETIALTQRLAEHVARGESPGTPRAAAALLAGTALALRQQGVGGEIEPLLRAALAFDPQSLPALAGLRELLVDGPSWREGVDLCERAAAVLKVPAHRAATLLFAARVVLARGPEDPSRAVTLLRQVLVIAPDHQEAFERLRLVLEQLGEPGRVSDLLAARIAVATNPFEISALRLARAELLAGPLNDRPVARAELETILHKEPQHGRALSRLADLQYEDGAFVEAAELYITRARSERSPERLLEIFLRLGRIYTQKVPDAKRGIGSYARVLQLKADNHEALTALSELYLAGGEIKNAIAVTERLVEHEPESARRVAYLVRLGQLWERVGDARQAGLRFRRAVDEAPRDIGAISELARHQERTHDLAGRRVLLDHALSVLRFDIHERRITLTTLRATIPILQWRGKVAAAAAAAQLVAAVATDPEVQQAVATWAAPPPRGRSLQALATPEVDDVSFPSGLLPGVRNIFRLLGPALAKGVPDLKRYQLGRGDRLARGQPPRDIIDPLAVELGVGAFDVYVKRPAVPRETAALSVEPGDPPSLILGSAIVNLGPAAIRFAAARSLRLVATHLDLVMQQSPEQTGALVAGVVRQFVNDYRHPQVSEDVATAGAARVGKVLSRKLRQEVMHFALEIARGFDLSALVAAVRDGANAVGLLASGDLPAALAVILATRPGGRGALSLEAIAADDEALALLNFALSDLYADLVRAME